MSQLIYMDSHATTPIDPRVLEAMMPYLTDHFGNAASSTHLFGKHAKDAVDAARDQVADLIGCSEEEIIFTSGATESDNLAVKGVAYQYKDRGNHIITSTVEHHAVLDSCKALEELGFDVTYLPVDKYGMVHPQQVEDAITDQTVLISLIYVNGEVGTINPITEVGEIAEKYGILFHSDATQGIGKIGSAVDKLKVDLMSFTAHKMYGPKGIGALYVRKKTRRSSCIHCYTAAVRRTASDQGPSTSPALSDLERRANFVNKRWWRRRNGLLRYASSSITDYPNELISSTSTGIRHNASPATSTSALSLSKASRYCRA